MTNIAIPIPPSLQRYREHLREFIAGMVMKLDQNSHKETPTRQHVEDIIDLLRGEIVEFEQQLSADRNHPNALVELMDQANYSFLAFIALRNDGVPTYREKVINEYFTINPEQGKVFCKKTRPGSQYKVGEEIRGARSTGYVVIKLQSRRIHFSMAMPRSHLVWWAGTGKWPIGVIDHENRNRGDDRLSNLRDLSFTDNALNNGKTRRLPRFVTQYLPAKRQHVPHYGKFVYQRVHLGVTIRCAYYDTPEEAEAQGSVDWHNKISNIGGTNVQVQEGAAGPHVRPPLVDHSAGQAAVGGGARGNGSYLRGPDC